MVSFGLVRKMIDWVKEGRRRPNEAVRTMARFCICGVFNLSRAEKLLGMNLLKGGRSYE
jgi:hypothetical protein